MPATSTPYLLLMGAILAEVIGTTALKASNGFTRLGPALLVVAGYGLAFFLMSLTLRSLSVGFVYAVWSGIGIVLVTAAGAILFGEKVDLPGTLGMALIVAGVVVLNVFSRMSGH